MSFIISGPEDDYNIPPNETLGKYFIDNLRRRGKDEITNKRPGLISISLTNEQLKSDQKLLFKNRVVTQDLCGQFNIWLIKRVKFVLIDAVTGEAQTCGQLLEDCIKAVYVLRDIGIKKNDVIALISENTVGYNVPLLAAFCMGVIVNPLNAGYKIGELRHALSMSKPKLIICEHAALKNIDTLKNEFDFIQTVLVIGCKDESKIDTAIVSFDKLLKDMYVVDSDNFVPESLEVFEQGAVIMLSSGTSGLPKGVLLTHQNLRGAFQCVSDPRFYGLYPKDTVVAVLPFFHIYVLQKFQVGVFLNAIQLHKVNKLQLVPSLVSIFNNSEIMDNYDISSIQEILVASAPIAPQVVEAIVGRFPRILCKEAYGATELSGSCTVVKQYPKKKNCIGSLLPGLKAKVCDVNSGRNLECMAVGELCFKGFSVMKCYVGHAGDNRVIDEYGFYHSGDVGYYDEEGNLYIVDRLKELIKYKGFQVSPTELEELLLSHNGVNDCAVVGIPDERAGQLPTACVVRQPNTNVTEQEIIDFVAERISVQKHLHGGVIFVDHIPKTASGKIQRRQAEKLVGANIANTRT